MFLAYLLVLGCLITPVLLTKSGLRILSRAVRLLGLQHEQKGPVGCRRIGLSKEQSNLLHDEHDQKYRHGDAAGNGKTWKVKSLWVYPIKSCGGVELAAGTVISTGLKHDRAFSFARRRSPDHVWEFWTQRSCPVMAKVHTELWLPDSSVQGYSDHLPAVETQGILRASFPFCRDGWRGTLDKVTAALCGQSEPRVSFDLPYQPTREQIMLQYTIEDFKIWKETIQGVNMASHIPPELEAYFAPWLRGHDLSLFRVDRVREVFRDAPRKEVLGWQPVAGFNDAYPLNLLGLSSLRAVEAMMPAGSPKLSARRFRANILIEGTPEFDEDDWKYIHIGGYEYYVACHCVRCLLPNVDPDTGIKHKSEPDATLRSKRQIDKGAPPRTGCLAVQLVPRLQEGTIRVGDVVEVMERGELVYTPMGVKDVDTKGATITWG